MRNVEIEIFPISASEPDHAEIRKWLDHVGATTYEWPQEGADLTGAEAVIGLAAKRCYLSFEPGLNPNVTRVRSDWSSYFENILKSGHGSVMEHAVYTFAIEGISRVFTGEMNRHRAGVGISEGSMRYIRYTDIPWWIPSSMRLTADEKTLVDEFGGTALNVFIALGGGLDRKATDPEKEVLKIAWKKLETQETFQRHYSQTEVNYARLQEIWSDELDPKSNFHGKKQVTSMVRRIIPMGVATGGVWTMNMRAVRHILALRASDAAEEEIAWVFSKIGKYMVEREPRLLCDFSQTPEGYWVPKYPKV